MTKGIIMDTSSNFLRDKVLACHKTKHELIQSKQNGDFKQILEKDAADFIAKYELHEAIKEIRAKYTIRSNSK